MECSYARSTRYGFDRARWRGPWKVAILEYLICAIQNIMTLIRHGKKPVRGALCLSTLTALGQFVDSIFGLDRGFTIYLFRKEGDGLENIPVGVY